MLIGPITLRHLVDIPRGTKSEEITMSRIIRGTLLLAACLCFAMSRAQAEDRQNPLAERTDPHCPLNQVSRQSPTVRGQSPFVSPGAGRPVALPRGRAYYNNRYFGNFNNRFYGPQYGYF